MNKYFLPIINSTATNHLTATDWQHAQIDNVALDLPTAYLKPGIAVLQQFYGKHLNFFSWSSKVILNGKNETIAPYRLNSDCFKIQSLPYRVQDVLAIARSISAQYTILPSYLGASGNRSKLCQHHQTHLATALKEDSGTPISLLVEFDLLTQQALVVHPWVVGYVYDGQNFADYHEFYAHLATHISQNPHELHFVMGDFDWQQIMQLWQLGVTYVQSNTPAQHAAEGILYHPTGSINIIQYIYAQQFTPIDDDCQCYCCSNFSRAYLHHLYKQNVLLAIKLQVLHNLYFINSLIKSAEQGKLPPNFVNN